jgi:hypothetical protein
MVSRRPSTPTIAGNCGVEDMALGELAVDGFITMQLPDKCADSKSN